MSKKEKQQADMKNLMALLHIKPWIDEVKIKCPKCQKEMSRIADVEIHG
jgi:uncharacterized protein with PIN domain